MLAVSLQPTPLRWMRKVVPTGPRVTSRGGAVGGIQNDPCFLPLPAATQNVCAPPRSSGVSKRNSAEPAASAAALAITRDTSSQPPPVIRLPPTVVQLG